MFHWFVQLSNPCQLWGERSAGWCMHWISRSKIGAVWGVPLLKQERHEPMPPSCPSSSSPSVCPSTPSPCLSGRRHVWFFTKHVAPQMQIAPHSTPRCTISMHVQPPSYLPLDLSMVLKVLNLHIIESPSPTTTTTTSTLPHPSKAREVAKKKQIFRGRE